MRKSRRYQGQLVFLDPRHVTVTPYHNLLRFFNAEHSHDRNTNRIQVSKLAKKASLPPKDANELARKEKYLDLKMRQLKLSGNCQRNFVSYC